MRKHIIGLVIFSFIVGAAAVVYAIFNVPEIIPVFAPQYAPVERTHCKMRREIKEPEINSIEVEQATINLRTKEFNWEIIAPETDAAIKLHFFSKGNYGTKYLISSPVINFSHTGSLRINKSFRFLYDRESYENLYVIGEFYSESKVYNETNPPEFDIKKATAVTFNYGDSK